MESGGEFCFFLFEWVVLVRLVNAALDWDVRCWVGSLLMSGIDTTHDEDRKRSYDLYIDRLSCAVGGDDGVLCFVGYEGDALGSHVVVV